MKQFDPRYQEEKDGPLNQSVRDRIQKFRQRGSTLADIAKALEFSGPFVSQLLNEKRPARVRSIHIPRIIKALEEAESEHGREARAASGEAVQSAEGLSLEDLINAIDARGFDVSVRPKARR